LTLAQGQMSTCFWS